MSNVSPPAIDLIPPDMWDAITEFEREAADVLARVVTMESKKPPPIIYHYTNDVGLKGILETGRLWFTDIFDLNDPSELLHGFSHAVEILNNKAANGPPETKEFAKSLTNFYHTGGIQKHGDYFLCSFSARGNDLGQWRSYADNGRGYALGFDTKALEGLFNRVGETPIPNNLTFSITYDDEQLAEIQRQMIEKMFPLLSLPHGRSLGQEVLMEYALQLSLVGFVSVLRAALFFKHEAYSNEKEFRFLQIHKAGMSEVKWRARAYSLIRYREFDWRSAAPGALKKIIVGPANQDKASEFAKGCLRLSNLDNVEIVVSKIPYRAV